MALGRGGLGAPAPRRRVRGRRAGDARGTRDRVNLAAGAFVVASSLVALVGWTGAWVGGRVPVEVRTGEASYINTWSEFGTRPIESSLIRKYEFVVTACDRYRIYHLDALPHHLGPLIRPVRGGAPGYAR